MKVSKILAIASIVGVVVASASTVHASAWHPKGAIHKSVQNQTTASALSDANDTGSAVIAKPGDILKYVIEINNTGAAGDSNEMHATKLTDILPAGVQLISDPAKRQIAEDLGVIIPGQKITKEYLVKVVSAKDGEVIENQACFTGDSKMKNKPQEGCDVANIKVSIPKEQPKPETPKETPKPPQTIPQTLSTSTTLPQTGAEGFLAPLAAFTSGAAAYAGRLIVIKRRQQ